MATCEQLVRRWQSGLARQSNWRNRWDDVARYILQHKGDIISRKPDGGEQVLHVFDTTATDAVEVMSAGLVSHIMPAGEIWFQLRELNAVDDEDSSWFSGASDMLLRMLHWSNFYEEIFECLVDLSAFGICCGFIEQGTSAMFNFIQIPVGTFVIEENAEGKVDVCCRKFEWTARQMADKWGVDKLPDAVRDSLFSESEQGQKKFEILHWVYPREYAEHTGLALPSERPWASVFIDVASKTVLEEDGYFEKPFFVCRLMRGNNEIYGRGPGDKAMPEIRYLQRVERAKALAVDHMVNPGWIRRDGIDVRIDARPGGVTFWNGTNQFDIPQRLEFGGRLEVAEQIAEQKRESIRNKFYVRMFQALSNPDVMKREKTAFEVSQIVQEELVLFSPMFGRISVELLDPMLRRCFGILARSGKLEPPPYGGGEIEYRVDYVSKIALAVRAAQSSSLSVLLGVLQPMMEIDPSVVKVINWRKAARGLALNLGVPRAWQTTDEEMDEIIAAEQEAAQAAQAQQLAATAKDGAAAVRDLGTDAQGAAMDALMGGGQ
jgi:hypothetical protein